MFNLLGGIATRVRIKRVMCKYDKVTQSHVMTRSMDDSYLTRNSLHWGA